MAPNWADEAIVMPSATKPPASNKIASIIIPKAILKIDP
jgi:hypothetical protein